MAAPTRNNQQNTRTVTNATSATLASYTPSSGSNSVLVVRALALRTSEADFTLSATFGGAGMTAAATAAHSSTSRWYRASIFYLINPGTSAGDIVITASQQAAGFVIDAVTLLGAAQSSLVGATDDDAISSATTNSLSLVGCAAESLIVACVVSHSGGAPTWTWSTATEDFDLSGATDTAEIGGSGGYYATAASGDVSLSCTRSASAPGVLALAVEFKKAGGSPQTVSLNTIGRTLAAVSLAVIPGARSVSLNTLARTVSAVSLSVVPGVRSINLSTLSGTTAAVHLSVAPGAMSVTLSTLTLTGEVIDITVSMSVLLQTLALLADAEPTEITPGTVAIALQTVARTLAAVHLTVAPGVVTSELDTLSATAAAVSLSVIPGATAVLLDVLTAALAAVDLIVSVEGVDVTVTLATLGHALEAVGLAVAPGGVAQTLATLAAVLAAGQVSISGAGADELIALMTLSAAVQPSALTVAPGAVVVALQELAATVTVGDLLVFMMLGCAVAGNRARYEAVVRDAARGFMRAGDRTGCR